MTVKHIAGKPLRNESPISFRSFQMSQESALPCGSKGTELRDDNSSRPRREGTVNGCMGHGTGIGTGLVTGSGVGAMVGLRSGSDFRFNTIVDPIDVDFNGLNLTLKSTGQLTSF